MLLHGETLKVSENQKVRKKEFVQKKTIKIKLKSSRCGKSHY